MVASRRFPIKTLLLSAGLSASLALLGCATNSFPSSKQVLPVPQTMDIHANQVNQTISGDLLTQEDYRSDWSTDRIFNSQNGFKTSSFSDSIKPQLNLPAVERKLKSAEASGGFANEFAKDLPGAQNVGALPNTPAVIGNSAYFLTNSESGVNFFSLRENGQVAWELSLHDNGKFNGSSPAVGKANPNVLFAISDLGRLYAVNATTGIVVSFAEITEDEFVNSSPFVVSDGGGKDSVYLASQDGKIYRYIFNGSKFTLNFEVEPVTSANRGRFSVSPVVTDRYIYIGSEEGKIFKLDRLDGDEISSLNLGNTVRAQGCMVQSSFAVDLFPDIGLVSCGSYLFKIRLNDSTTSAMSLRAQSPLLELRKLTTLKPTQILGPNHNNRPQLRTTVLRDPEPSEADLGLEQVFGFQSGDFIRIDSNTAGFLYGEIDEIDEEGVATLKGEGLYPLASPSPDPILLGGEDVYLSNLSVRPSPVPSDEATPEPTATPSAGADPVTRFAVGSPDSLKAGDYIRFPNLPDEPVHRVCSASNTDCEDGSGSNYAGIEAFIPEDGSDEDLVYLVTVPGTELGDLIEDQMAENNYVPFEKIQNQVIGNANSTIEFALGNLKDFRAGQYIRVMHRNGSLNGRYEYGVIESITSTGIRLTSALIDDPKAGDVIDIIDPNTRAVGRVTISQDESSGNILSSPVLRGNGQHAYVQHGNALFELDYSSDSAFQNSSNFLVLQSARLNQSNLSLTALSRSMPLVLDNDKLLTVDTDPSNRTGIFMNRVLLPLSSTAERLNDIYPILSPNSLGLLPNRAETQPVVLGANGYAVFGGGNGVAYKLHKDVAW